MDFGASIIAVIGLADKVISRCHHYLLGVKDCPSDLRVILVETSTFKAVVENLRILCQGSPDPGLKAFFGQLEGKTGPIEGSKDCLQRLEKLLPVDDQAGAAGKKRKHKPQPPTLARLAWPFHETKAKKLLNELSGLRSSISLALTADVSRQVQAVASQVEEIRDKLTMEDREKVLRWLVTTDPSWLHNSSYGLREEHTGLWLERSPEFKDWKDGTIRFLWLYGIPGAGKTILLSHIVESTKRFCNSDPQRKSICVYYYCYFDRKQDETVHLLRWLSAQLARKAAYIPLAISRQYEAGEQPSTKLLMSALSELCSQFSRIYLLIDALDESLPRLNLLNVLELLSRDSFENIKILVTSRKESDITYAMSKIAQPMPLNNRYVDEDIAAYVKGELSRNPRLGILPDNVQGEVRAALVEGASGMFRWAACQLDILSRLHTVAEIRQALRALPKSLDATYERILLDIPEEHRLKAKMALLLLTGPNRIDKPDVLAEAIMVDVEERKYNEQETLLQPEEFLLELCSCLIKIEREKKRIRVRLAHYTVKEYLYSQRTTISKAAYFHGSDELASFLGGMASLIYLRDLSYVGVPSAREYLHATESEQDRLLDEINKLHPFLDHAILQLHRFLSITNPEMRAELDRLIYILIHPGAPHFRWWEWRVCRFRFLGKLYPLWESWEGQEAQYAMSIACSLGLPSIVSMIFQLNPMLAYNPGRLTLEPLYAKIWVESNVWNVKHTGADDMRQQLQDYLPRGTVLEIALRLGSKTCARVVINSIYDAHQYINADGLSGLSIAIKSLPLDDSHGEIPSVNADVLLEAGANVNVQPVSETPLQSATELGNEDLMELLLEKGAFVNEVGDDAAIVDSIKLRHNGSADEDVQRAIESRGFDKRYKTPLCILMEDLDNHGELIYNDDELIDLLKTRGALSLHLFPIPGLPGYCAEDWKTLEEAGWIGTRRSIVNDSEMS